MPTAGTRVLFGATLLTVALFLPAIPPQPVYADIGSLCEALKLPSPGGWNITCTTRQCQTIYNKQCSPTQGFSSTEFCKCPSSSNPDCDGKMDEGE